MLIHTGLIVVACLIPALALNMVLGLWVISRLDTHRRLVTWLLMDTKSPMSMWLWVQLWPVLVGRILLKKRRCKPE